MDKVGLRIVTVILISALVFPASVAGEDWSKDTVNESLNRENHRLESLDEKEKNLNILENSSQEEKIEITHNYSLTPSRPGNISVVVSYHIPKNTDPSEVPKVYLPRDSNISKLEGFIGKGGENYYEWNESTNTPKIAFSYNPNRTQNGEGTSYERIDAGEWAFVTEYVSKFYGGYNNINLTINAANNFITSGQYVFLGEYKVYNRTSKKEKIRIVVPEDASLDSDPQDILDDLVNASNSLDVGAVSGTVTGIALPKPIENAGGASFDTFWVGSKEEIDKRGNTWIHEYIHTRQDFAFESGNYTTYWLSEGTATYYSLLLEVKMGNGNFDNLRSGLLLTKQDRDVVLGNSSTWGRYTEYGKGAAVVGSLDERIREETGGNYTFEDVFWLLNKQEKTGIEDLRKAVEEVAGEDFRTFFDNYVKSSGTPLPPRNVSVYEFINTTEIVGDVKELNRSGELNNGSLLTIKSGKNDSKTHISPSIMGYPWAFYNSYSFINRKNTDKFPVEIEKGPVYLVEYVQYTEDSLFPKDGFPDIYMLDKVNTTKSKSFKGDQNPEAHVVDFNAVNESGRPIENITVGVGIKEFGHLTVFNMLTGESGGIEINRGEGLELTGMVNFSLASKLGSEDYNGQGFKHEVKVENPVSITAEFTSTCPPPCYEESSSRNLEARTTGFVVKNTDPETGEKVEVDAIVQNPNRKNETVEVTLYKNARKVESKEIEVDKMRVVSFNTSFKQEGKHKLRMSGINKRLVIDMRSKLGRIIANLESKDDKISFSELQKAIQYWATDQTVPKTNSQIEFDDLQKLIELWVTGEKV